MEGEKTIITTLRSTINLYKFSFKICFFLSLFLAVLTEYFRIYAETSGVYYTLKEYLKKGDISGNFPYDPLLAMLSILSIIISVIVYGSLLCLGEIQFKKQNTIVTRVDTCTALYVFKNRFWSFSGGFFISIILSGFASFLGIVGVWLNNSFTYIIFPMILSNNVGVLEAYKKTFVIMVKSTLYTIKIGFIVGMLSIIKYLIFYIFFPIRNNDIFFGIQHAIIVFTEALMLPFLIMLMVSVYNHLQKQ